MKSAKRDGKWWVTEVPESEDCGPYDTKAEAEEGRVGLERTEKWGHLYQFWTSDKRAKKKPVKKPVKKPTKKKTTKKKRVTR